MAHLREVLEEKDSVKSGANLRGSYGLALLFLSLLAVYALSFNAVLPWIHEALEVLAR